MNSTGMGTTLFIRETKMCTMINRMDHLLNEDFMHAVEENRQLHHHATWNKQYGMFNHTLLCWFMSKPAHTTTTTHHIIVTFDWKQFDHPIYNLDVTPSYFHVFHYLKSFLADLWFHEYKLLIFEYLWICLQGDTTSGALFMTSASTIVGRNYVKKSCKVYISKRWFMDIPCSFDWNFNSKIIIYNVIIPR